MTRTTTFCVVPCRCPSTTSVERSHSSPQQSIINITDLIDSSVYGHLGDKPTGRRTTGRQSNWATANWATHFGQLGDNIGRLIKEVYVGKIFEIKSF